MLPCVEVNYLAGLFVSCLQMVNCHNFTHFCAVSLKILKPSPEQGVLSIGHCSRCSIVRVAVPQLHKGSPVWYPHLIKFALVRPTPALSRLSFGGRLSDSRIPISTEGGLDFNLSIHRSMFVPVLGWTWLRKDLDFNLVFAGTDPNSGCLGSVDWRKHRNGDRSRSVHVAIPVSFAANSATTSSYKFSLYSNQLSGQTFGIALLSL